MNYEERIQREQVKRECLSSIGETENKQTKQKQKQKKTQPTKQAKNNPKAKTKQKTCVANE